MTQRRDARATGREKLIRQLQEASRVHSTATVLAHAAIAAQFGLGPTDIKALELLERLGPMTPGQMAAVIGLGTSSVTSVVDRLESRGLAHRARNSADRRQVIVELDRERTRRIFSHFENLRASAGELWSPYSIEELHVILDFLKRSATFLTKSREVPKR